MSFLLRRDERRETRWYFGGFAACCAVLFTHPLDLLKVLLQTDERSGSFRKSIQTVFRSDGIKGFYNGLSASLLRQAIYTTTRFAIYEMGKDFIKSDTVFLKGMLAVNSGVISGLVGVPMDVVNVRMQNDMKLPIEQRRNYKHVGDGLMSIYREGGLKALFSGGVFFTVRGILMTIGQSVVYDEMKPRIKKTFGAEEGVLLHLTTSICSVIMATLLTQPVDVLKTRKMNSEPGKYTGNLDVIMKTAKEGPQAFFKGLTPSFLRMGPQTVLLFMFMEQFRLYIGKLPKESKD